MIAVDWGTSNFRAYRVDREGNVLARRTSTQGILAVQEGNFEAALHAEIGAWLADGETQVLLCGMVGSRQGWLEAPYLDCPGGIVELADAVVPVRFSGAHVRLVPGLRATAGAPELMRGEESAAMGVLDACGGSGLVCFPGTHSKWVQLIDRKIDNFTTSMTGEVFSAVKNGTILGRMMTAGPAIDETAFLAGVRRSSDAGGLLHHLFGVRSLTLTGELSEQGAPSYLSGLLIGHEVRSALFSSMFSSMSGGRAHLVGATALCQLYAQAIHACGGEAVIQHEDAAAFGLAAIGRRLQWI